MKAGLTTWLLIFRSIIPSVEIASVDLQLHNMKTVRSGSIIKWDYTLFSRVCDKKTTELLTTELFTKMNYWKLNYWTSVLKNIQSISHPKFTSQKIVVKSSFVKIVVIKSSIVKNSEVNIALSSLSKKFSLSKRFSCQKFKRSTVKSSAVFMSFVYTLIF